MNKIINKEALNNNVILMDIEAPKVAKKAQAGQFIILRVDEFGERIPLTINDTNLDNGTVRIIFQVVGNTTEKLNMLNVGDYLQDFVGPLGKASDVIGRRKVCVVGGGVGSAIAYPIAKAFKNNNTEVHSIVGFRNKDLIILEDKFKEVSIKNFIVTDDGSNGNKGLVTDVLKGLINSGEEYDEVFAIGPLIMMKFVTKVCMENNIKCIVSMNPIMIDGTGMCGGCRLTVNGKKKFACVDGPDFDGSLIDFDEAMSRNRMYLLEEKHKREENCRLHKVREDV